MADRNRNDDGVQVVAEDSLNDNSSTDNSNNLGVDVNNSGNDNSTDNSDNSLNVGIDVDDSGNDNSVDNSVDNSDNSETEIEIETEIDDSFNTDVEIDDSFNDNSTNFDLDVDVSDSFQDNSDNSVRTQDSFNVTSSFNTQTLNDHSTTIGVRQYQAGFGDFNAGFTGAARAAGGAGGGDLFVDNRSLQVDQSVSQAIDTGGGFGSGNVSQAFSQEATISFGDGSYAAGDDLSIDNSVFNLNIGDIAIGNTDISTRIEDAFKDQSTNYDVEFELDIEDSFNDQSDNYDVQVEIDDSFTSEVDAAFENSYEWENSGNIFSPGAGTTGGEGEIDF